MIFYRSFYEALNDLPDSSRLKIYDAIFSFGINLKEIELTGLESTIWKLIKPQIEANNRRFENGKLGAEKKQKESKLKAKGKQTESKPKANVNVNVNSNENNNENCNENGNINLNKNVPTLIEFSDYAKTIIQDFKSYEFSIENKYNAWIEAGWKDGNGKKIVNWKSKLNNTIPYLRKFEQRKVQEYTPKVNIL